jgi:peptidylprolyl isomerase
VHLGRREVIAGLERGIVGMRVGGRRRLVISPHLAYGEAGVPGVIPPNAVVIAEVELLDVQGPTIAA